MESESQRETNDGQIVSVHLIIGLANVRYVDQTGLLPVPFPPKDRKVRRSQTRSIKIIYFIIKKIGVSIMIAWYQYLFFQLVCNLDTR